MNVLVLGGGVIGLATAWYLRRDGHDVTLVERRPGVGLGASFANGGQLSYSYVSPLASPEVLPKIPFWLLGSGSPLRLTLRADPKQWRWCIDFLLACNSSRANRTTRQLLALSLYSRSLMHDLVRSGRLEFGYRRSGKLVVHTTQRAFEAARQSLGYQAQFGCTQEALDLHGCLRVEPALAHIAPRLAGGIYTPSEDVGDCHAFCNSMYARLSAEGVRFLLDTEVLRLLNHGNRLMGAETTAGVLHADYTVLALGDRAAALAGGAGLRLPIYPLKGYSITVPIVDESRGPRVSVTDFDQKIVYARLGNSLRVAGMAELGGEADIIDPKRIDTLVTRLKQTFPQCADLSDLRPWAGMRPATPRGTPIIGICPLQGLLLNVGHGALGFTLTLGSGSLIADIVSGRSAAFAAEGFQFGRS